MRMTVSVILAERQDSILRVHSLKKAIARRRAGAMVSDLQDVGFKHLGIICKHSKLLTVRLCIARQDNCILSVFNPQYDAPFIHIRFRIACTTYRSKHSNSTVTVPINVTVVPNVFPINVQSIGNRNQSIIRSVVHFGKQQKVGSEFIQQLPHCSDMIGMWM